MGGLQEHCETVGALGLTVDAMAKGWHNAWRDLPTTAENRDPAFDWRHSIAQKPQAWCAARSDWLPTLDNFIAAALQTNRAAGIDRWSPREFRIPVRIGPWLLQKGLFVLWRETTTLGAMIPVGVRDHMWFLAQCGYAKG